MPKPLLNFSEALADLHDPSRRRAREPVNLFCPLAHVAPRFCIEGAVVERQLNFAAHLWGHNPLLWPTTNVPGGATARKRATMS